jgi:hypothetical protein
MGERQASAASAHAARQAIRKARFANAWTMLRFPLMLLPQLIERDFDEASHAFPIQATEMGED